MINWFEKLFGNGDKLPCDEHGLPYVRDIVPMPKVKMLTFEKDSEMNQTIEDRMQSVEDQLKELRKEVESDLAKYRDSDYLTKRKDK